MTGLHTSLSVRVHSQMPRQDHARSADAQAPQDECHWPLCRQVSGKTPPCSCSVSALLLHLLHIPLIFPVLSYSLLLYLFHMCLIALSDMTSYAFISPPAYFLSYIIPRKNCCIY